MMYKVNWLIGVQRDRIGSTNGTVTASWYIFDYADYFLTGVKIHLCGV